MTWGLKYFSWLFSFVLFALFLVLIYILKLADLNAYMGYFQYEFNVIVIAVNILLVCFLVFFIPKSFSKPSDTFIFLYFIFVIFPYFVFYSIRREEIDLHYYVELVIIAVPFFLCPLFSYLLSKICLNIPWLISEKKAILTITIFSFLGVVMALSSPTPSAGFDIDTLYVRRLEGRQIFTTGSVQAYINGMIMNGFSPLLAFYAFWKLKVQYFLVSILCWLIFFYLIGVKAPLLYILMSSVLGLLVRWKLTKHFFTLFITGVLIILIFSLVEIICFDYSYVADYLVRRAFTVPPYIVSAFFDFMWEHGMGQWSLFFGVNSTLPVTFVVGEQFLGMPNLNANTNAFVYALGGGGIKLFYFTVVLVCLVFSMLDIKFQKINNPIILYTALLYSVLILEQSATTALVSSGLGILVILAIFLKPNVRGELVL